MSSDGIVRSHFWVTSYPFCDAMLFLCSQHHESEAGDGALDVDQNSPVLLRLFDSDGGVVNELEISSEVGAPIALELDQLLERCKLESGLRHGHLMVEHQPNVRATCRLQNRGGAVLTSASSPVYEDHAMFSPVILSEDRSSMITLVNFGPVEAQVRIRLMFGSRSPDTIRHVAPFGANVVCLEQEFIEELKNSFGKPKKILHAAHGQSEGAGSDSADFVKQPLFPETRAYVRVSVRNEQTVGVQLIESTERGEQGNMFTAVSG